jgi:hypothetical protein
MTYLEYAPLIDTALMVALAGILLAVVHRYNARKTRADQI